MDSLAILLLGFQIISVVGFVVGVAAGMWAIWRGHIGKGIVACIFCVPYTYFMIFEPSIRPTRMEPKGTRAKNIAVMVVVAIAVVGLLIIQVVKPPLNLR